MDIRGGKFQENISTGIQEKDNRENSYMKQPNKQYQQLKELPSS